MICVGLFFILSIESHSQDQSKADSIKKLYWSGNFLKAEYLELDLISQFETNPDSSLFYADLLVEKAKYIQPVDSSFKAYRMGYLAKGNALLFKGENSEAIQSFLNSLEYSKKSRDERFIGLIKVSIADTYVIMGNDEFAELYYNEGIDILRKIPDSTNLAGALLNAGDWLITVKSFEKALLNFKESSLIYDKQKNLLGKAYNLGNIGIVYAEQNKDDLAEQNINEAITILEKLEDYYPISVYLTYLADIYAGKNNFDPAFKYAKKSLDLSKNYGLKEQISEANLKLSELHEAAGNENLALGYFKDYIVYRDSIRNVEEVQKISNAMTKQAMTERDLEFQKRKNQRIALWSALGILLLIGFLAVNLFKQNRFVKKTNIVIANEKQRSDELLLNILPEDTAKELKDKGSVEAKKYEAVTVFFSDFKGFTKYAENLSPETLVKTIDHYFSKFDSIIEKYGLEKIKTIGDAYMAAGGLNHNNEDHAKNMILAAQEMIDFVFKTKHDKNTDSTFDIRIGINTGPVVAGVVGTKKFAYDIWGDTVNIAARMESSSEPGRINISEDTYKLIKDDFNCNFRGKLAVKNRGELNMYFVNS